MEVGVPERYFNDTTFIFKLLRFMNLMEPGRAVISLTKLFVLTSIFALAYVLFVHPDQIAAVMASAASAVVSLIAHSVRRAQNFSMDIGTTEIIPGGLEPVIDPIIDEDTGRGLDFPTEDNYGG